MIRRRPANRRLVNRRRQVSRPNQEEKKNRKKNKKNPKVRNLGEKNDGKIVCYFFKINKKLLCIFLLSKPIFWINNFYANVYRIQTPILGSYVLRISVGTFRIVLSSQRCNPFSSLTSAHKSNL